MAPTTKQQRSMQQILSRQEPLSEAEAREYVRALVHEFGSVFEPDPQRSLRRLSCWGRTPNSQGVASLGDLCAQSVRYHDTQPVDPAVLDLEGSWAPYLKSRDRWEERYGAEARCARPGRPGRIGAMTTWGFTTSQQWKHVVVVAHYGTRLLGGSHAVELVITDVHIESTTLEDIFDRGVGFAQLVHDVLANALRTHAGNYSRRAENLQNACARLSFLEQQMPGLPG